MLVYLEMIVVTKSIISPSVARYLIYSITCAYIRWAASVARYLSDLSEFTVCVDLFWQLLARCINWCGFLQSHTPSCGMQKNDDKCFDSITAVGAQWLVSNVYEESVPLLCSSSSSSSSSWILNCYTLLIKSSQSIHPYRKVYRTQSTHYYYYY